MKKLICIAFFALLSLNIIKAQNTEKRSLVDFSATFKTSLLWRGLTITDKPMMGLSTTFNIDKQNKFTAGIVGGISFSNDSDGTHYKEIDYYVKYADKGLSISLWDYFNTRGISNVNIWDYNSKETGHLLDLNVSYKVCPKYPLTLKSAVLIYGKGDSEPYGENDIKQRYSTYVEMSYPCYQGDSVKLNGFVGAGFALNGKTHIYGNGKNKFDFVNVGFVVSKILEINELKIPVSLTTAWNPSSKIARVQLNIRLL